MIYGIIFVTMLFLIVGSVRYIRRHLIPKNANENENKKYMIYEKCSYVLLSSFNKR